ncbi:hypothetical protein DERF_009916 [Dermatophagoides farinae]|uniref:Uncharacterized protein n=1 Tax=Dermatophagoides farinae TaxID=6954 RepID=A0A922HVX5_DERFA|nr:hypothetical protein DERF_009916 [Dermatophagoides farinae]
MMLIVQILYDFMPIGTNPYDDNRISHHLVLLSSSNNIATNRTLNITRQIPCLQLDQVILTMTDQAWHRCSTTESNSMYRER